MYYLCQIWISRLAIISLMLRDVMIAHTTFNGKLSETEDLFRYHIQGPAGVCPINRSGCLGDRVANIIYISLFEYESAHRIAHLPPSQFAMMKLAIDDTTAARLNLCTQI